MMPKNSAWLAISEMSFGAGVAVQHSRHGVAENISVSSFRVFPASPLVWMIRHEPLRRTRRVKVLDHLIVVMLMVSIASACDGCSDN
jgi:hypothetical protein